MDEQARKIALCMISYGVYILTSKLDNEVSAATVTWVSQASFEPPMLSVCIKRSSGSYKIIKNRGEFLLHMLGEDQKKLASRFLKPSKVENDRINGEKFEMKNDLPLLAAVPSYIRCRVLEILDSTNVRRGITIRELEDQTFKIDDIYVPMKRRRTIDPVAVNAIAESILEEGQRTPILVRRDRERVVLVEGLQRLEACRSLGEKTIVGLIVQARHK